MWGFCRDLSDVAKGGDGRSRKRLDSIAQGFSPGLAGTASVLKAPPTPRLGVQFGEGT
jgi:hypothetical protein